LIGEKYIFDLFYLFIGYYMPLLFGYVDLVEALVVCD